jgi:hypothetical protein
MCRSEAARSLAELVEAITRSEADVALSRHPERNNVYAEANFIAEKIAGGSALSQGALRCGADLKAGGTLRAVGLRDSHAWPTGSGSSPGASIITRTRSLTRFGISAFAGQTTIRMPFAFLAHMRQTKIVEMAWGSYYKNATYELVAHAKVQ